MQVSRRSMIICYLNFQVTSVDSVANEEDAISFPEEYLNSVDISGLPPHKLILKPGTPILLLRNIDPRNGLCNGTRLICKSLGRNIIQAEIATGPQAGKAVLIPRIVLISDSEQAGVEFRRRQFPVRLAFAMTINKSQGQTFEKVGICLTSSVFCHGQLYVALSRVRRPEDITILLNEEKSRIDGFEGMYTANVVYKEVL